MTKSLDLELPPLSGHILLVEDEGCSETVWRIFLENFGVSVSVARNGEEALDCIKSGDTFNVVLMDLIMPVMDGFEATKAIRNWERSVHRKPHVILAQTADVLLPTQERAFKAGINGFFHKPLNFREMYDVLAKHLN